MSFKLKPLTQHLLLAGLISISPLAAQAADNDADARIEKLEQQVNLLLEKLEQQNVQLNQQQEDIQATKAVTKNAVITKTNGRSLSFESADGDFNAQIGGRIQADAAFYDTANKVNSQIPFSIIMSAQVEDEGWEKVLYTALDKTIN